jgi:hypothetical protein
VEEVRLSKIRRRKVLEFGDGQLCVGTKIAGKLGEF